MKKLYFSFPALVTLLLFLPVQGLSADNGHAEHAMEHDHAATHEAQEHHQAMETYKHQVVVENIRVEFQVMSLASMDMTDPAGNSHHIMVSFFHDGMDHQLEGVVGKIKVISPSKKEQTNSLQDYGSILAANFSFNETGNWGVICMFKIDGKTRVAKFWYPHS